MEFRSDYTELPKIPGKVQFLTAVESGKSFQVIVLVGSIQGPLRIILRSWRSKRLPLRYLGCLHLLLRHDSKCIVIKSVDLKTLVVLRWSAHSATSISIELSCPLSSDVLWGQLGP